MVDVLADRQRWKRVTVAVLCAGVLVAAIGTDLQARIRAHDEELALAAADTHLSSLQRTVIASTTGKAIVTQKRNALRSHIAGTLFQLASVNASLAAANVHAYLQGASISTLQTCLGGVQNALGEIAAKDNNRAAQDIAAVSGPCTQLAGGSSAGLVYPFDFPDPDVILVGQTYYAYATNSVAGNIQIITSNDLTNWTAVGNALPSLPTWAAADFTWAPSVAVMDGRFRLYYAVDTAGGGGECISVATSAQPQGPYVDRSTGPLECQKSLGGSIDPAVFTDRNGDAYLEWKSNTPGATQLWTEQLDPTGKSFAPGASPTALLTADQPWEAGTIEAPDMVSVGSRYFLFYSGNDWNSSRYAVGVATCAGPLGPCTDASPNPIVSSGTGMAGPGGESIFADASGQLQIAFHAWVSGAVGFPNSRDLYLRHLDVTGPLPAVGTAG